jgi:cytochrome bd ubiquinol oxidase subunit I
MHGSALALFLSRLDFAWITTMHVLYPPLTVGLSILLFCAEWLWMRSNDERWYRLVRFFEKIFIVNFAGAVATGITLEMAFGILYGPFSAAAGPFFGQVLGYETITAFMYEAGFLGLMVFGWGKLSKGMHLFATFNVAFASCLSVMWILDANSWMQTPGGVELKDGYFHVTDWAAALFNHAVIMSFPHMLMAAIQLALCFVAAVAGWFLLKGRHVALFQRALKVSVLALVVVAPLQVYVGDELGRVVAEDQPAALAAMEGHYHTNNPDGSTNTTWHIIAWPNAKGDGTAWSISIPHVLSVLETHTWSGAVEGLDSLPPQNRPPVVVPFYAFRVMVGAGFAILGFAFWGAWLALRGELRVEKLVHNRWFLRAAVLCGFMPYIAVWCGWWVREIGREPWVVYGMMTTAQGVSPMSVAEAALWLGGFIFFELMVWGGVWYFFAKVIRRGPDMESHVVHGTSAASGGHGHAAHGVASSIQPV